MMKNKFLSRIVTCVLIFVLGVVSYSVVMFVYKDTKYTLMKDIAVCAVTAYLEAQGYDDEVEKLTCGVDKMENYWVNVEFYQDQWRYMYVYRPKEPGIFVIVPNRRVGEAPPQHCPDYDDRESGYIVFYYGLDDYLQEHDFSEWETYVKRTLFEQHL